MVIGFFFCLPELCALRQEVKVVRLAAFASGTRSNLQTHWTAFFLFCLYFHLTPLPASLDTLSSYAIFLARTITTPSIRNYLHGIKTLHLFLDLPTGPFLAFQLSLLLKGLANSHPHTPIQALPVTPRLLLQIHSLLDLSSPLHANIWCAFLLTFFLFARKSNMVPPSTRKFNPLKHLCRKDISLCPSGLSILLKWSKTNQSGLRLVQIPVVSIPGSPLCPLAAFTNLVSLIPAAPKAPAFCLPKHSSKSTKCLTHHSFVKHLRKLIAKTGQDPTGYSGHSFRRGGATFAFRAGVPGELIQMQGDWKSEAYLRYLDFSLESKLQVTTRMAQVIKTLTP